jgi:hypothetical protein
VADSEFVPSAEAADTLGVSQQEVRRLVGAGALRGTMVANRVMVDRVSLELRTRRTVTAGARRTPANAWAMLRLVTGDDIDFLDRVTRSKLRAALRQVTADRLVEVTARRAVVHHYRVRDQYLPRLLAAEGVVRTGLSAIEDDPEFDLVWLDAAVVDVYCEEQTHQRIRGEYGLVTGDELSKVTLRVVDDLDRVLPGPGRHQARSGLAVRVPGAAVAVTAAVCVDLMENLDTRVVAAGRQRLDGLLREFRAQAGTR